LNPLIVPFRGSVSSKQQPFMGRRCSSRLARNNKTGALHGLLEAGIKNLRCSEEVRLAGERAAAQSGLDPLRQYAFVDGVNLREFVDAAEFDGAKVKNDRQLHERFCSP
jgi:hypothetical protein